MQSSSSNKEHKESSTPFFYSNPMTMQVWYTVRRKNIDSSDSWTKVDFIAGPFTTYREAKTAGLRWQDEFRLATWAVASATIDVSLKFDS